jgi:hypothetical protein
MEEEGKNREGAEWWIGIKKVILFGKFWNCYFMFIYVYITTRNQKARRANKAFVVLGLLGEAKLKLISR